MPPAKLNQVFQAAVAHHEAGRLAEAEKLYAKARVSAPYNFDVFHLSGWLALQQSRPAEAVTWLERAGKLNARSGLCALRLAHALKKVGRLADARAAAERSVTLEPNNPDAHFCAGDLAAATESFAAAVPHFRRVTELQPTAADGWANLGVALTQSRGVDEALGCFARALSLDPTNVQALNGRALVLQESHRAGEAIAAYDEVLRYRPAHHEARSARLLTLHYVGGITREQMYAEHRAYAAALGGVPAVTTFNNDRDPERKLRIAFLSPDLRAHSVAYFVQPLIANLDPEKFEVVLYHDHVRVDAMSEQLRAHAQLWRNFAGQPANVVEGAIRSDALDILIDLAGHTGFNRLPLLSRRLAPVQVTYLGYPDTTGIDAMDYRFVDAITDPEGAADAFATEKLVRFASTAWLYAPPASAPEPASPPSIDGRTVTFGCFNNFAKVSDVTLRGWAAVLNAVSNSRILIKAQGLDSTTQQELVRARFAAAGIDPARVEMLGRIPGLAEHLSTYARVDIALDTFPYQGTTTTCEALWMGVPVITVKGEHHMSRVGASLLEAVGHPEWIAQDTNEFARIAVQLAGDRTTLARLRGELRGAMKCSPLLDHARQAERFGEALRRCWTAWCHGA